MLFLISPRVDVLKRILTVWLPVAEVKRITYPKTVDLSLPIHSEPHLLATATTPTTTSINRIRLGHPMDGTQSTILSLPSATYYFV